MTGVAGLTQLQTCDGCRLKGYEGVKRWLCLDSGELSVCELCRRNYHCSSDLAALNRYWGSFTLSSVLPAGQAVRPYAPLWSSFLTLQPAPATIPITKIQQTLRDDELPTPPQLDPDHSRRKLLQARRPQHRGRTKRKQLDDHLLPASVQPYLAPYCESVVDLSDPATSQSTPRAIKSREPAESADAKPAISKPVEDQDSDHSPRAQQQTPSQYQQHPYSHPQTSQLPPPPSPPPQGQQQAPFDVAGWAVFDLETKTLSGKGNDAASPRTPESLYNNYPAVIHYLQSNYQQHLSHESCLSFSALSTVETLLTSTSSSCYGTHPPPRGQHKRNRSSDYGCLSVEKQNIHPNWRSVRPPRLSYLS